MESNAQNQQQALYEAFGVDPETARLIEKNETLLFRISPNRYVKKCGTIIAGEEAQCLKLEIYNGSRLAKSFQVYEPPNTEVSNIAHDLFAKIATTHLVDTVPSTVQQYGKK